MGAMSFQQALIEFKPVSLVRMPKLTLPKVEPQKGYDTPYLRRRMQGRLRGHYG